MQITRNAFCFPGERIDRITTGFGVYSANGLVPYCQIKTTNWRTRPETVVPSVGKAPRIYGPTLFAGAADFQFGFVLLNSLGRLWALDRLPPETTVFYATKQLNGPNPVKVLPTIVRSLGLQNPIMISDHAAYFDELITVPEIFGEIYDCRGTSEFYDWVDRRWPPASLNYGSKVYLTRSGLGKRYGRFACEDYLEHLLAAEGYDIVAPESLTIQEQIALYQTSERLIFAESSAVHLYSLVRRPGQIAAVIQRRDVLPEAIVSQMQDRDGAPPIAINAVQETFWPPLRGDHLGISILDFDLLREGLVEADLIRGNAWVAPSAAQVEDSINKSLEPGQKIMGLEERNEWLRHARALRRNAQAA
jgi:hypothetical protein